MKVDKPTQQAKHTTEGENGMTSSDIPMKTTDEDFEAADEALWDEQFANSPDVLDFLAREGREEYYAGLADEFDPDNDPDAP